MSGASAAPRSGGDASLPTPPGPVPQSALRIRLATRAIIVSDARLLLVNAYPDGLSDLWCAPGGGVEPGASLPDNLIREVFEETGLRVLVGPLALVSEFHDPGSGLHQVDLFFRCQVTSGSLEAAPADPDGVVTERRYFSAAELREIRLKPDSLPEVAFDAWAAAARYDPFEEIAR